MVQDLRSAKAIYLFCVCLQDTLISKQWCFGILGISVALTEPDHLAQLSNER